MRSYRIKTEEEYERIFTEFKENVNRKVNQKVNLDDWSFCIVSGSGVTKMFWE